MIKLGLHRKRLSPCGSETKETTFTKAACAILLALTMLAAVPAQAGGKHGGKHHGGGHGHGGHFKGHFVGGYFGHNVCFTRKVKLWDPFYDSSYWDYRTVCRY